MAEVDGVSSAGKGTPWGLPTALSGELAPCYTSHQGQVCSHGGSPLSGLGPRGRLMVLV